MEILGLVFAGTATPQRAAMASFVEQTLGLRRVDAGFLVLGGPLADEHRVAHAVEADSETVVRETLARDPWSGSHLVVATVDPWIIRLDGRRRA